MTKYILHGGYTDRDNELNHSFFKEVVKNIPQGGVLLIVNFAFRGDNPKEKFEEQHALISRYAERNDLSYIFATQEDFLEQLTNADAVYISGGSTNKLLKILKTYPDLNPLVEGKTVAGSSAGAYAIAKYGPSHDEAEIREGLGLVPIRVVCHYESPDLPPNLEAVKLLENTELELEIVYLKDCEWKVFS